MYATPTPIIGRGSRPTGHTYDVVVVGARAAGAATAMLLARHGVRVLVVDRATPGSGTLSTHALMRGAVERLHHWGLLDAVAAVSPAIRHTTFEYGRRAITVDIAPARGVDALYAPRRERLDPILVSGAEEAGAATLFGARVTSLERDEQSRVRGVVIERADGSLHRVATDLVIGADGLRSFVARQVGAPVVRAGNHCSATIYRYVAGADLPTDTYIWSYGDGQAAGSIPTSDGQHCVFVALQPTLFRSVGRSDVAGTFDRILRAVSPRLAAGAAAGTPAGSLRAFPGHRGQFRAAHGPGWALVGDAGYFKDPAAAHGMTDAFRDAQLLADAVRDGDIGRYQRQRDELSGPLFEEIDRLASFEWTAESLPPLHRRVGAAMTEELNAFNDVLGNGVLAAAR